MEIHFEGKPIMEMNMESMENAESMEPKHSAFGIASFILSIFVGMSMFLAFVIAGVMEASRPGGMDEQSIQAVIVGLAIITLIFLDLVAVVLGIVGLFQKNRKKVFAILGVIFSSVTLMLVIGVIILGLLVAGV